MTIDPVQLQAIVSPERAIQSHTPGADFARLLNAGVQHLDATVQTADVAMQRFALGENIPVHDVMIAMEHAQLSMQFAVAVRNRVVEAYQSFLRMQV
ncbi:MAG TPA: flagellar hook-basal body complex protein FliE [Gammaproteobacteria bacterium]|nr:flagellar hook-basal body complex protein FliE [Gammaproteobacteria bacterium]